MFWSSGTSPGRRAPPGSRGRPAWRATCRRRQSGVLAGTTRRRSRRSRTVDHDSEHVVHRRWRHPSGVLRSRAGPRHRRDGAADLSERDHARPAAAGLAQGALVASHRTARSGQGDRQRRSRSATPLAGIPCRRKAAREWLATAHTALRGPGPERSSTTVLDAAAPPDVRGRRPAAGGLRKCRQPAARTWPRPRWRDRAPPRARRRRPSHRPATADRGNDAGGGRRRARSRARLGGGPRDRRVAVARTNADRPRSHARRWLWWPSRSR